MESIKSLRFKYRLYGPKFFVLFSFLEAQRFFFFKPFFKSYSQYQEDIYLSRLFKKLKTHSTITYLDIGANHPVRFNNTYHFYLNNYHGINVEPNPTFGPLYTTLRPKDTNLNLAVSSDITPKNFYILNPDVSSTFEKSAADKSIKNGSLLQSVIKIKSLRLEDIFEKYAPKSVDILSVDTEGHDYQVLSSNNWQKFSPPIICVESDSPEVSDLLKSLGYHLFHQTALNSIYAR